MGQVTIYLDDATEERVRAAARAAKLRKPRAKDVVRWGL